MLRPSFAGEGDRATVGGMGETPVLHYLFRSRYEDSGGRSYFVLGGEARLIYG
jgi:hypothetical protein